MLTKLDNISLRSKLVLIVTISIFIALATVYFASSYRQNNHNKEDFYRQHNILADVMAKNTRAAMAFSDSESAARTLLSLSSDNSVNRAILYLTDGRVFAGYPDLQSDLPMYFSTTDSIFEFSEELLHISVPVKLNSEVLGTLYLQSSLDELNQQISQYSQALLIMSLVAIILATLLALMLLRTITDRILSISELAAYVTRGGDFRKFRLSKPYGKDEIGHLGDSFYNMLNELGKRKSEIEDSENRYRALVETAPFLISELNCEGEIISTNRAGLNMLGANDRQDVIGKSFFSMISSHDINRINQQWDIVLKGKDVHFDYEVDVKGKKLNLACSLVPIFEENKILKIINVTQDITTRMLMELRVRQSKKMEAVGQLTSGIAHDFNNILQITIANIELLKTKITENSPIDQGLNTIQKSIDRGVNITNKLLNFAAKTQVEQSSINLSHVIEEMNEFITHSMKLGVKLELDLEEDLWNINVNKSEFEDFITNLVLNARDAIEKDGVIIIKTWNYDYSSNANNSTAQNNLSTGKYVAISVSDTGKGIPAENLERIYDPFFTTKPVGKGTGLGLSMAFAFVQHNEGFIDVNSKLNEGTVFRVYFPKASVQTPVKAPTKSSKDLEVDDNKNNQDIILVVDDEENILMITKEQLVNLGYNVITTSSPAHALDLIADNENISLLITDIIMPGEMNGYDLTEHAKKIKPNLNVLHTSGYNDVGDAYPGQKYQILYKPYRISELTSAIRSIFRQTRKEESNVA